MENKKKIIPLTGITFGLKFRGMTRKELADNVGVSEEEIRAYEEGKKEPTYSIALEIAGVLRCEMEMLV